jgi:Putative prokaryotic signal transducing protein
MIDAETGGACPFCGCELEIGASACPSCDLPLLTSEPAPVGALAVRAPLREFATGDLRRVAVAANQVEADMLEGLLRSEGIPCLVRRSFGSDVPDFLAAGRRDILVPEGGLAAARSLLQLPPSTRELPSPPPLALAVAVFAGLLFVAACVAAIILLA